MTSTTYQILCQKIISGGQTGVDRGALDACLNTNFACGGWCPKGRTSEDGTISEKYPLIETKEKDYSFRTQKNVIDSDGTLIIAIEKLTGGTLRTKQIANEFKKPTIVIYPEKSSHQNFVKSIILWLKENSIKKLNVAGPRNSEWKNGYKISFKIISRLIYEIDKSNLGEKANMLDFKN